MNMKKLSVPLALVAILGLLSSPAALAGKTEETYGAGVTLEKSVPVLELLDNPEAYVGKSVRVELTVE